MSKEEKPSAPVPAWHCMTTEEVYAELDVPADIRRTGLSTAEANKRLEKYGENKLTEVEKETLLQKIWNHLANVLVGILVFVAIISVVSAFVLPTNQLTQWLQVAIIFTVIV